MIMTSNRLLVGMVNNWDGKVDNYKVLVRKFGSVKSDYLWYKKEWYKHADPNSTTGALTFDTGTDLQANACWSGPSYRKVSKKEFMVGMPQHNIKEGVYNTCDLTHCEPEWTTTTDRIFQYDYNGTAADATAGTQLTSATTRNLANTRLTYG